MSRGVRYPSETALAGTNARIHDDTKSLVAAARAAAPLAVTPVPMPQGPAGGLIARGALPRRKMNGTERAYAAHLALRQRAGEILWYEFEAITLKLAEDTRYTPDFPVLYADGTLGMIEVKGLMRDDAFVKLKVAAKLFPFRFTLVRKALKKNGGGFVETPV